ncbi:hypothetical protein V497_01381 [Pseudogymnoascus sp. VKM F-4516 (FW-969)]|nr:hypothetical protein V497_01381 [Pseudogymnoascus sp. VKM F-4516 (FW-969)]
MAIHSSFPRISVTVHNAQGQLPEYADAEPDVVKNLKSPSSVVVSNYIEAPSDGGPFWLKFGVEAPYMHSPHIILFIYDVQGTSIRDGRSCGPLDLKNKQSWGKEMKGYRATNDRGRVFRDFQFTKLEILPGDDQSLGISETEESKARNTGVFEVRVLLGRLQNNVATKVAKRSKKPPVPKPKQPKRQLLNKTSEIPSGSTKSNTPVTATTTEKIAAKKSLSLGLTYKEKPLEVSSVAGKRYTYINGWNNPIARANKAYEVDLQRLLLIEKTPEPEHLPEEILFPGLPTTSVPAVKQESEQEQQTQGQQISQPAQPASTELSAVTTPSQCKEQKHNHVVIGNQHPPAAVNSAVPLYPSPLAPISKAFDELKFTEVRDLARKQHKCFDELNGDEVENFARQKLAEAVVDTDGSSASHTSKAFDDLTFAEVWDFARKNYKDFDELNRREIEELARQGYSQALSSSQAAISGSAEEPNVQGKRKAHIKQEDVDEDVVFVSAAKVVKRQKGLRNTEIAVKEEL